MTSVASQIVNDFEMGDSYNQIYEDAEKFISAAFFLLCPILSDIIALNEQREEEEEIEEELMMEEEHAEQLMEMERVDEREIDLRKKIVVECVREFALGREQEMLLIMVALGNHADYRGEGPHVPMRWDQLMAANSARISRFMEHQAQLVQAKKRLEERRNERIKSIDKSEGLRLRSQNSRKRITSDNTDSGGH
ncbi:hypothetical protein PMAYCL1PPCAC_22578 [Pristionchus mayeri]|uniref:Uncharacterized protein n=1 Tax=Pristionchus mayeri TaxID=1317129 RepID=A0AAN5CWR4_9BILA|nr:hypothetical protein PMAYCL1PPCAC_22578 [Pristionchus mayeri]